VTGPLTPSYREHWGHMPSLFDRIFGRETKPTTTRLEVTGQPSTFTAFSGDPYANDIYRAGVDAIARIAAKFVLQPKVRFSDGTEANADDRLAHLLQVEPNPHMTAYDLLYCLYTHLYTTGNSFAYLQREYGRIVAVWPLHVTSCDLAQAQDGRTVCALTFANGRTALLDYGDIVHLRRHFNAGDVMGDPNDAIQTAVRLAETQNQGIEQAIKQGSQIRGLVKYAGSLSPSKLEEYQKHFNETQLTGNTTGIITTPQEIEFTPVTNTTPTINAADVEATKKKIFDYLGITEAIVNASFDDDGFGAFDESVIEALALQASLEWTRKVYHSGYGRRIDCSTNRIRYMGTGNKVRLIETAAPMGMLSVNEARDLMGLPAIEGGDRRFQSLNYANVELVDRYQLFSVRNGGIRTLGDQEADSAQE